MTEKLSFGVFYTHCHEKLNSELHIWDILVYILEGVYPQSMLVFRPRSK